MRKLLLLSMLWFLWTVGVVAQTDPLNSAFLPAIDTTCTDYPANVWITSEMQKVFQNIGTKDCTKWQQTFYGTQNEFVSFQIHFHDAGAGTPGLSITLSSFVQTAPASFTIAASDATHTDIVVYREAYMNVTSPSTTNNTGQPANIGAWLLAAGGSGKIPDILIPNIDPYYHQTTNAWPFTVAASQNQSAWVDIHIPTTAPAGYYKGNVTVQTGCPSSCVTVTTIPVIIGVWQWPAAGFMPSTTTLKSWDTTGDQDFCRQVYNDPNNCSAYPGGISGFVRDEATMFLDNRESVGNPALVSSTSGFVTDYGPYLSNTGSKHTSTILPNAQLTQSLYRSSDTGIAAQPWITMFTTNGWTDGQNRTLTYPCDEPPTGCAWSAVLTNATTAHSTTPPTSMLLTANIHDATTNSATNVVDIFSTIINDIDPCSTTLPGCFQTNWGPWDGSGPGASLKPLYAAWLPGNCCGATSPRRELWSYLDNESSPPAASFRTSWPNWQVDGTPVANRAMEWLSFLHGATGELYFATTTSWGTLCGTHDPWVTVFCNGNWGDGTLTYPGRQTGSPNGPTGIVGTTTPIWLPSLRLKLIRNGVQDYEYMNVLTNNGKGSLVQSAITSWITNSTTYNNILAPSAPFTSDLPDARVTLGTAMHQLTFAGGPPQTGAIAPARSIDWTQAGIPSANTSGVLPSATWAQCGPTISAYTGTAATINGAIQHTGAGYTACASPNYVFLAPGTFFLSTSIDFPTSGMTVLRGSGANSTFLMMTGATGVGCNSGFSQYIAMCGPDSNNQFSTPLPPIFNWTGGYTQGTATPTLTLSATTNIHALVPGVTAPTFLFMNQCDTGLTGATCGPAAGTNVDNGAWFVSSQKYTAPYVSTFAYSQFDHVTWTDNNVYTRTAANQGVSNSDPTNSTNWTNIGVASSPTLGSGAEGSDGSAKGSLIFRWVYEIGIPTNVTATTVTLLNPIKNPDFATGLSPQVWITQPMMWAGIENLTLDSQATSTIGGTVSAPNWSNVTAYSAGQVVICNNGALCSSTGGFWICQTSCGVGVVPTSGLPWMFMPTVTLDIMNCYQCWVSGVAFRNTNKYVVNNQWSSHTLIKDSYFYNAWNADPYGLRQVTSSDTVFQNNIEQRIRSCTVKDGPDTGTVIGYNLCINSDTGNDNMWASYWDHSAIDTMGLNEGNIALQARPDYFHGSHGFDAFHRNFLTGWESCASGQCGAFTAKASLTWAVELDSYNRNMNFTANVLGTPGFHVNYSGFLGGQNVFAFGKGNVIAGLGGLPPNDSLVQPSTLLYGNWDSATNATRFCGSPINTGWSSICVPSTGSEVPTAAPVYPNPLPTVGDTVAGQPAFASTYYLSGKPAWWQVTGQPAIPFPGIGPDITGGNLGECSTSASSAAGLNTAGQFNGLPSPDNTHCVGSTRFLNAWGGHVNWNPAMAAYTSLGGNLDGTSPAIPFDASVYQGGAGTPGISITPNPIAFGAQNVGTTSAAQFATLLSNGSTSVTVTNIAPSVNFNLAAGGSCGATPFTLGIGANCTVGVTFTPPSVNTFNGTLSVTDNAAGSPQSIALTGSGAGNIVAPTFSPPPTTGTVGTGFNGQVYPVGQLVTLTLAPPNTGATICYQIGGFLPTTNGAGTCTGGSLTYSGPITVPYSLAIKVIATQAGFTDSTAETGAYQIIISPPKNLITQSIN